MKSSKFLAILLLLIAAIILWKSLNNQSGDNRVSQGSHIGNSKETNSNSIDALVNLPKKSIEQAPASSISKHLATPQILEAINDYASTYDPKELVHIEPYLLHSDPQVRNAAIDGMVTLGDSSASVMLKKASEKAPTTSDAIAMLQAAEYLELPSARGMIKKK